MGGPPGCQCPCHRGFLSEVFLASHRVVLHYCYEGTLYDYCEMK